MLMVLKEELKRTDSVAYSSISFKYEAWLISLSNVYFISKVFSLSWSIVNLLLNHVYIKNTNI